MTDDTPGTTARDAGEASRPRADVSPRLGRGARLALLAAAVGIFVLLAPRAPHDQTVHVVLGDPAPRVTEVDLRYADARDAKHIVRDGAQRRDPDAATNAPEEDWTREATFRYALSSAPRVVTHAPRLPDGEYVIEIELVSPGGRRTLERAVTLRGGSTSVDVSRDVP